jgi:solute carrier family 25 citrate transporter 1
LKYQGPVHAASTIVSEEGLFALWNGLTPTLFRNATNQAFNFMAFDYLKRLWGSEQNQLSFHQSILTGLVSGAIGPFINAPCDVIKTRLMQQDKSSAVRYSGFLDAFRTIWRDEGYLAFYKGFLPRISRIAPGQAITWTVVEQVNKLLS